MWELDHLGDCKSKGVTHQVVCESSEGRSTDSQVDVLAAFLDDAEGAGLSDESFVALMDRLDAVEGRLDVTLFG